MKAEDT